jgi:hypothetical protein
MNSRKRTDVRVGGVPSRSIDEFIAFWAWLYTSRIEPKYTNNVGQRRTFRRVRQLFRWKFPRFADYHKEALKGRLSKSYALLAR